MITIEINGIRITLEDNDNTPPFGKLYTKNFNAYLENDPCSGCSNDPRNGGTGICHCTIPYLYGPHKVTC